VKASAAGAAPKATISALEPYATPKRLALRARLRERGALLALAWRFP